MLECRRCLPAYKQRDVVLSAISQNQVCKADNRKLKYQLDSLVGFVFVSITYIIFRYVRSLLSLEKQVVARPHKFHSLY